MHPYFGYSHREKNIIEVEVITLLCLFLFLPAKVKEADTIKCLKILWTLPDLSPGFPVLYSHGHTILEWMTGSYATLT